MTIISLLAVALIVLAAIQLVPVAHTNPPVQTTVQWDSPQTRDLAGRACMDCRSNETTWPWFTYIAPGSWLTVGHVNGGRQELNLSELTSLPAFRRSNLANQMAEQIRNGAMPPADYMIIHPQARLTQAEKEQLVQGLQASLAGTGSQ